jgi:outer membrane autotransporter protein
LQNHPANAPGNGGAGGPAFGVWAGGLIRSGNQDGRNGSAAVDFETDGVSFGADYRFNDAFAFGAGVGYGRDDSDIGEHGSRSEGDAFTLAAYASYSPGERFFLDGLVGYQQLNYDLRRYVTVNANTVAGSRDGDQWFASVSAGADIQNGDWQVTPYARMDVAQATLDGYTETGDPLYALAYGDMDVDTTTGNLGVRVDYRVRTGWGLFSPQLRLEYQHDFQGNGAATMQYADFLTGPVYRAELDDFDRNRVNVGLGGLFGFDTWSLRLEYRGLIGSGGDSDHGVLLNIEKRL